MTKLFIYIFCEHFLCIVNVVDSYVSLIMVQTDVGNLVAQMKDLERKNAELEEQNKELISKVTLSIVCMLIY